ncbi:MULTISPECIES: hypothetical protein [unclassified Sphingopyxis]|jgi:hypothetical protein|uniref:hypothetical protein n=1 Tax=unclassified Sphingopyxis TaxID=2614943 RepID=UPI0025F04EEB|nr:MULTISPECIES: hypothetical protein [unclassified Sphingopyxis]
MRILGGILGSAALTTAAVAEPMAYQSGMIRVDGVVGVGLTIPIGGQQKKAPPRIELRLTRDVVNFDGTRQSSSSSIRPHETRIGFSLERERRLLVNGQPIDRAQRNNVSTVGWIAIGVGVVVIGGLVLAADALRDASE